jgi:hypothetical protein
LKKIITIDKPLLEKLVLPAIRASIALSVHCVTTAFRGIMAASLYRQVCTAQNFTVLVVRSEDEVQIIKRFPAFTESEDD